MRARSFRVIFRVFFGRDPAADAPHFLGPRETLTSRRWRFVVSQSVEITNPRSLRNRATGIWVVGYFSRASRKNRKNFSTFVSSSRKIYKHGTNACIYIYMHAWTFRSFHPINSRWGNFWKKKRTKMAVCPRDGVDKVSTALITGENRGRPPTRSQVAVIRPFGGSVVTCFGPSRIPSCHLPRLSMYKWQNTFIEPKWLSTREFRYSKR